MEISGNWGALLFLEGMMDGVLCVFFKIIVNL